MPAHGLETLVAPAVADRLATVEPLRSLLGVIPAELLAPPQPKAAELVADLTADGPARDALLPVLIERVRLGDERIEVRLEGAALRLQLDLPTDQQAAPLLIEAPLGLRRRGVETRLVLPGPAASATGRPDPALLAVVAQGHAWFAQTLADPALTLAAIAAQEKVTASWVGRLVDLAFLASDIVKVILAGRQPPELTARNLTRQRSLPLDWAEQRRTLGFADALGLAA